MLRPNGRKKTNNSTSRSPLWREYSWKNNMRFFINPKNKPLQNSKPESSNCWRQCGNTMADHYHIFWTCPAIKSYWREKTTIKKVKDIFEMENIYLFSKTL